MARKRTAPKHILVRATVGLSGLPVGKMAYVDPTDPLIAELIENRWLVEEPDEDASPQKPSD